MYSQVYGNDTISLIVPVKGKPNEFIVGRGREICRLHWDVTQEREEDGAKPNHYVVVLAKVDHAHKSSNRFNDGKADPKGRLWAGK